MSGPEARSRARILAIIYAGVALWVLLFHDVPWGIEIPHLIAYALLIAHAYRDSVSREQERTLMQRELDLMLPAFYIALALSMGLSLAFPAIAILLFIVEALRNMPRSKRPLLVIATVGFLLAAAGYEFFSSWLLALAFLIALIASFKN